MIKLFLAIIFLVSSSVCFAGAEEEEAELKFAILDPIMNHFSESSSSTRLMSKEIIEYEKNILGRQATLSEVSIWIKDIWSKTHRFNDDKTSCALAAIQKCYSCFSTDAEVLAYSQLLSWKLRVSNCNEFAKLVMLSFEFNRINNEKLHIPTTLKSAMLITTFQNLDSTGGDHSAVLVEGNSKTMFLVDPWLGKVIKLNQKFPPLSYIIEKADNLGTPFYWSILNYYGVNKILNIHYKNTYYDVWFVNENTHWKLRNSSSKNIHDIVRTCSKSMRKLYEGIRLNKEPASDVIPDFPQWQLDYATLLNCHKTDHTDKSAYKKPEKTFLKNL
ncbi:MAG: hypothetical protein K0R49_516 [Burkholderiales bacterium]|jgi:hypothetical protein|nr:hypothetical protein [Burkholderiales bacterium]